jgi:hypothetical protein
MKASLKTSTAKTIHVDFGSKKTIRVEEMEFIGQSIQSGREAQDHFSSLAFGSFAAGNDDFDSFQSAAQIDPARYIESVVKRFEEICDQQGLFDETRYSNPHVAFDAAETVKMLDRELTMLADVKTNLQYLLRLQKPAGKK